MNHSVSTQFWLDPTIHFLNHGSFGACPVDVLEWYHELQRQLERHPIQFTVRQLPLLIDAARQRIAEFVGSTANELAFVRNTTSGINAVVEALPLQAGDQVVYTNHGYNACWNILRRLESQKGVELKSAEIPFPLSSSQQAVDAIAGAVTAKTRLVMFDYVSSPTGLVFPAEAIVQALRVLQHTIPFDIVIDGAHAPGMLPLELSRLTGVFFAGNCHKWVGSPKGSAILRVPVERQAEVRPTVISHGFNAPTDSRSRFQLEFDWTGTDDYCAWLAVPKAIDVMGNLAEGGWEGLRRHNRELALYGQERLCKTLDLSLPAPAEMIGSLVAIPLPGKALAPLSPFGIDPLQEQLYQKFRVEVPIFRWPDALSQVIRVSAQIYNDRADYDALCEALKQVL